MATPINTTPPTTPAPSTRPTTPPIRPTRIHWWQSIRWRLALGSMLVAFLATALLALVVILTVISNYGVDQRAQLLNIGANRVQRIGQAYPQNSNNLYQSAKTVLPVTFNGNTQGESYLTIIFNRRGQIVYPLVGRPTLAAILLVGTNTSLARIDLNKVRTAIRNGELGNVTLDEIGTGGPAAASRPFVVQPIRVGGQPSGAVVGVLFMTPYSALQGTVPPFIAAVFRSVLIASLIVAVLAALAAILFSRTITRPLAKLTQTARLVAAGNYSAQVQTNAGGELGELAATLTRWRNSWPMMSMNCVGRKSGGAN